MEIEKYQKSDAVAKIDEQIIVVKTSYDLVRMSNIEIANQDNKHIIADMLMNLNQFTNVSRKMNSSQIAETVNMLLNQYPNMSLQEYQFFFNNIRSGHYGQLYESMDGIKIMAFLKEFYKELTREYHNFKEEEHIRLKQDMGCRDLNNY